MESDSTWKIWPWEDESNGNSCKLCRTGCSLSFLCIRTLLAPENQSKFSFDVRRDIPKPLYPDLAREAFCLRNLSLLKALVKYWPQKTFSLPALLQSVCLQCRSGILQHAEDEEDRLDNKVFVTQVWKALLDAYFAIVKDYTENPEYPNVSPPLTVFDLSGDSINGFMTEAEFRRLCKRALKVLDACVLARMHYKIKSLAGEKNKASKACLTTLSPDTGNTWSSDVFLHSQEDQSSCRLSNEDSPCNDFEIGTWGPTWVEPKDAVPNEPSVANQSQSVSVKSLEIPRFVVVVDTALSEKSCDILSWLLQRYEEFPDGLCPVSIQARRLNIAMNDERKLKTLLPLLPTDTVGLAFSDLHESRSLAAIAEYLPAFWQLKYLNLGDCPFAHSDDPIIRHTFASALSQLPHLVRLNLNNNQLQRCLYILDSICHGLEVLEASACSLAAEDLIYLAQSKHSQSLKALCLAENYLADHFSALRTLLMATTRLELLDLALNGFDDQQVLTLVSTVVGVDNVHVCYSKLRKLDLGWDVLRCETILWLLEQLSLLPSLDTLVLANPQDLEILNLGGDLELKLFSKMCLEAWRKTDPEKPELKLKWCLM